MGSGGLRVACLLVGGVVSPQLVFWPETSSNGAYGLVGGGGAGS